MKRARVWPALPAAVFCGGLAISAAATAQITVTPGSLGPWQEQNAHCSAGTNTGSTGFQNGPPTPPLGSGSARLTVGSDGDSFNTFPYTGVQLVLLNQITELRYSTYVQVDGSGGQAPYLILDVDTDEDGLADDQLFFEPVYQTGAFPGDPVPNQGTLTTGTWQEWNARVGGWWSFNAGTFGPPLVTLATYFAANPTAAIVNDPSGRGGLRVASGCGGAAWAGFVGNFDGVAIGVNDKTTTFDFEAAPPVITIDDLAQLEGTGGGFTSFDFTLTLSTPVSDIVTVDYTLTPGSASAPGDYVAASGQAIFGPQQTTTTITVQVVADAALEPDETFFVDLSNPQFATLGDDQAQGTIQNDDAAPVFADVAITKTGPAAPVTPGADVTYTIAVTNNGPSTASNVTVTDTIPAGTTYVSATPSQGSCAGTTTVVCDLGAIASGDGATVTLVVQAPSSAGTIVNTATVSNDPETDTVGTNDSSTATTTVTGGGPPPAVIPTLSTWGLLALVLALGALAARWLARLGVG